MSRFAAVKSPLPVAGSGDAKSPLFCPKPRRAVAPLRCHQSDAGMDLLDLLLSKVGPFLLPAPRLQICVFLRATWR
jgi:hypothetical protein